ncbi:type-F conjugative transfer system pilin assembly protein TrbC [Sphingorhabdus pulchriflava]|uniref:Type-F conjugative transfer system pilin assembly protein TrbC n=1 Tax=Sphingorhabdus pulchriflava TaxID=2292257 RepID=A0A371BJ69_9SPHN|nr:type-F conjugative transfer system pilin assembly protein TrbC [Sphingorhabdus pulchriflava]RDV07401.1 type-F conjugative transfer system pilin assembly protein TrbC [Sphingorhabdus pulchriflava]
MKYSLLFAGFALCIGTAAVAGLAAQSGETELDLAAIRARAAEAEADAVALSATARARAEQLHESAKESAQAGQANGKLYAASAQPITRPPLDQAFDFDRLVADTAGFDEARMGAAPRFIAFASVSMPAPALKQMIGDVSQAGGVIVFRGFPQGSAKALTTALLKVSGNRGLPENVGIDPRLFRAFRIDTVPAYVVTASDFDVCDGFDCVSNVPPHDRMTGNVSAEYALSTFAKGAGPGGPLAQLHLEALRKAKP